MPAKAMSEKLAKTKAWITKYWWVLAGAVLVFIGFFLGKGKRGSLREWRKVEAKIDKVEERKEARIAEIRERKEERIAEIEEAHKKRIETLNDDQKERYEELRNRPDKLNRYLNNLLNK